MENKTKAELMFGLGFVFLIAGIILNYFNIGSPHFKAFGGFGNWLLYMGFLSLMIAIVRLLTRKKRSKVDERMEFVATKALQVTFLSLIIVAFIVIIIDGIIKITAPYYLSMSYLICGLLVVYFFAYRILLKYY